MEMLKGILHLVEDAYQFGSDINLQILVQRKNITFSIKLLKGSSLKKLNSFKRKLFCKTPPPVMIPAMGSVMETVSVFDERSHARSTTPTMDFVTVWAVPRPCNDHDTVTGLHLPPPVIITEQELTLPTVALVQTHPP